MAINEITITTLGELIDLVTPELPDPKSGRRRDSGVYRGSFDASSPLLTSLDKLGGASSPHAKRDLEEHILRNFIRYSRPYVGGEPSNEWEYLISAQHHGVPTRLLDWSYSPLVATFFATRPHAVERDRAIWRLDWQMLHETFGFPRVSLLTSDLDRLLGDEKHFTPWQLFQSRDGGRPFACLLEPPSLDNRIVAQAACFTLSNDTTRSLDRFLMDHGLEGALAKYVIPQREVPHIRDQLDLVGLDERRLFPDLDGVAASLVRYYA